MPKATSDEEKDAIHAQLHKKEIEKKEFQKKYLQFQIARQYLAAMSEEKAQLESKLAELEITRTAMQKLKDVKEGEEMWTTLGSDVFMMSGIKDVSTAIVGVGAGVYIRKPIDRAIETIAARHAELAEMNKQLAAEIAALSQQLSKMEQEIQALMASMQAEEE
ncbi:MAG: prefoldin subunit alpha [Candidatus Aenigmatarchaeota archaeon]